MKILIVHNEYARPSGEEAMVRQVADLCRGQGWEVVQYRRSSAELVGLARRAGVFFTGSYSPSSRRVMRRVLARERPAAVNVHNLYPIISPSVLVECRRQQVPVMMTVHNYRLLCPNGLFFSHREICERCLTGNEWWCVRRNCEEQRLKSMGYALRNFVARRAGLFRQNVSLFVALTQFQREKLIAGGYAPERIRVIPNAVEPASMPSRDAGEYVAYAGRISVEKGIDLLLAAARACPDIVFRIAGHRRPGAPGDGDVPPNVAFVGYLDRSALAHFYRNARVVVLPSRCYEGLPVALLEAMAHGRATIGPDHGGIPEVIDDGATGRLFRAGDGDDFVRVLTQLWAQPRRCAEMGLAGYETVRQRYAPEWVGASLDQALRDLVDAGVAAAPAVDAGG